MAVTFLRNLHSFNIDHQILMSWPLDLCF